jgi:hypothetical protein
LDYYFDVNNMSEDIRKKINSWLILIFIALAIFSIIFFARRQMTLQAASDALFATAALILGFVGLMLTARTGVYDITSYSFLRLKESFKKGAPKTFEDAYTYYEYKREKRSKNKPYYLPHLVIGLLLLGLALLFAFMSIS